MKIIFLGPPGAGKGTHAQVLSQKMGLGHLATGDILRRHIREQTLIGKKAKGIMEKGELVSDELINDMMFDEMKQASRAQGFILDGYPRTLGQAKALDLFLAKENWKLDLVINFATSEEVIVSRLSGRRICPSTGRVYHVTNMPPKREGICDETGEKLIIRKDDEPETVRRRLKVYHQETKPLIEYYRKQNLLHDVAGDSGVAAVQTEILQLFDKFGLSRHDCSQVKPGN
ncbi:MAG: adenylate kinase [Candidatus Omnitrophota bacterium]